MRENTFDLYRQDQMKTIYFALKILSLCFSAFPLFQYYSEKYDVNFSNFNQNLSSILVLLAIICFVLFCWMITFKKSQYNRIFKVIETCICFAIFIWAIHVSGGYKSYYKFLYLFIIIASTMEYGLKIGVAMAALSSTIVVAFDLIPTTSTRVNEFFENDLALIAMFFVVAWTLGHYVKLEKSHIRYLTEFANLDGLTGIYNHRYFYDCIVDLFEHSVKHQKPLSLLMLDIDYFKKYNDIYGHKKGDELIKAITGVIQSALRPSDIFCRYGGDEFCILLPDTDQKKAIDLAHKIRQTVYEVYYEGQEHLPNKNLTISIGVASINKETENYNELIEHADMALYRAKFLRRNKVEVYSSVFDQLKQLDDHHVSDEVLKPLKALITVINSRDVYTYNHVERVVRYCSIMAEHLKLSKEDTRLLLYSAYLHDLGKINIPKEILITDQPLTEEQWNELKRHPVDSAEIVKQIEGLEDVVPIVLAHHERYDGTGYPQGLKGEEIPYLARILTVVDSFDAMTNQRPYQKIKTFDQAFEEIRRCKGTQFDPEIAEQFIEVMQSL